MGFQSNQIVDIVTILLLKLSAGCMIPLTINGTGTDPLWNNEGSLMLRERTFPQIRVSAKEMSLQRYSSAATSTKSDIQTTSLFIRLVRVTSERPRIGPWCHKYMRSPVLFSATSEMLTQHFD